MDASKLSGIYAIVNIWNDKIYVGSAVSLKHRWSNHRSFLKTRKHKNKHLQNSYNKYGIEGFVFTVMEYCEINKLVDREQFWIDELKSFEIGYNLSPTAGSTIGVKKTEEEKIKIGIISRGRKHTEESKAKISQGRKGIKHTDEAKTKMSLAKMGVKRGNFMSREAKDKISLAHKKISSEKTKEMKARSPETREKIRQAVIKQWERQKAIVLTQPPIMINM